MSLIELNPDRLPPHSMESERGLLGCLIEQNDLMVRFESEFPAGRLVFYGTAHQTILGRLMEVESDGALAVEQRLRDCGELELIGGPAYLAQCLECAPVASAYDYHAGVVLEKYTRRKIIHEAAQLTEDAWDESADQKLLEQRASEFLRNQVSKGVTSDLYTMAEIEPFYSKRCQSIATVGLSLSNWLPSLSRLRVLLPGNLVMFLASTGVGKTALLMNLGLAAAPMPTLFFQLELTKEDVFERMCALRTKTACAGIEDNYVKMPRLDGPKFYDPIFPNLHICERAKLNISDLEARIAGSEIKGKMRPRLVLVDYMGLVQGRGQSRYDRFSQIAEDLKILAKQTDTIVVAASQVGRKRDDDEPEVGLFDGKETGSLENSASLVVGAWREPGDKPALHLRVLKCNKGGSGTDVICNYNLDTLGITEQAKYADQDYEPR